MNITDLPTSLAWTFTHLLPGTFRRNKADFAHHEYPILGPLPTRGSRTEPQDEASDEAPFIYFVLTRRGDVCYVGKSEERNVLKRWIRPGNGGPSSHYWTHSTKGGGCVFKMAEGLRNGEQYQLRYASLRALTLAGLVAVAATLEMAERQLIAALQPAWNGH